MLVFVKKKCMFNTFPQETKNKLKIMQKRMHTLPTLGQTETKGRGNSKIK